MMMSALVAGVCFYIVSMLPCAAPEFDAHVCSLFHVMCGPHAWSRSLFTYVAGAAAWTPYVLACTLLQACMCRPLSPQSKTAGWSEKLLHLQSHEGPALVCCASPPKINGVLDNAWGARESHEADLSCSSQQRM